MRAALSLFSGAGGGALGARAAGYFVTACLDNDRAACATLNGGGFPALQADVKTFDWSVFNDVELLVGGPPCQPFSAAGKQTGFTDPRDCIPDFIRAVEVVRPRVFILENVRGLTFKRHRDYLELVLDSFPSEYRIDYRVLNAADYGIAQTRQRLFIVGRTDDDPVWPVPTHAKAPVAGRKPWVTVGECLERRDLPRWAYERPSTTIVGSFNPEVIAGPGYRTAGDSPRQKAPGSFTATVEERARIQGFPPDWHFAGSKSAVNRQLGNACPPALIQAVVTAQEPFHEAPPDVFYDAIHEAWDTPKGELTVGDMLTKYTIDEYAARRLFLSEDRKTGFAIDPDGDLQSMFNVGPTGRGAAAVATAVRHGAKTLDCLGPYLPGWYIRQGWKVDRWEDNWTPGGPAVAYMRYEP